MNESDPYTPKYEAMLKKLDDCRSTDEGETIQDLNEKFQYYVMVAKNLKPEQQVVAIRLRAERNIKKLQRTILREAMAKEESA